MVHMGTDPKECHGKTSGKREEEPKTSKEDSNDTVKRNPSNMGGEERRVQRVGSQPTGHVRKEENSQCQKMETRRERQAWEEGKRADTDGENKNGHQGTEQNKKNTSQERRRRECKEMDTRTGRDSKLSSPERASSSASPGSSEYKDEGD